MPTTKARHSITETAEIAEALDDAALVWPELREDRAALLRKLVEAGHQSVSGARQKGARSRMIRDSAGVATGVYPPNAAARLKSEWDE